MKYANYLCPDRIELGASGEWVPEFPGWCLLQLKAGEGYWLGAGLARALHTGEVVVLLPLREGLFRASQLGPATLDYFRFYPELISSLLAPAESDALEAASRSPEASIRFHESGSAIARCFTALNRDGAGSSLRQKASMLGIIAEAFAGDLVRPVAGDAVFLSARQRLRLLINEIPEGEFLKLSSREMAARCGNSVKHFNRSFRKLYGMSLAQKQELLRLQAARQALLETASRIETVASDAGYENARAFSTAFKKRFGVTPSEWRHPRLRKRQGSEPDPN